MRRSLDRRVRGRFIWKRKIFLKFCTAIFKANGFTKNGTVHFYKELGEDIMLVVGLQHSAYSELYYFDGGFIIKSVNKHMPYPKFYNANIRLSFKICIDGAPHVEYTKISEAECELLKEQIQSEIDKYAEYCSKETLAEKIIATGEYVLCQDYDMQSYFGGIIPYKKLTPDASQMESPEKEEKAPAPKGLRVMVNIMAENGRTNGAVDIILDFGKKLSFLYSDESAAANAEKYGREFENIQINPYCVSEATLQKLGWKEKKLVSHAKKRADIRLLMDYERFSAETPENRRRVIIETIIESIRIIGKKAKEDFDADLLISDILHALDME